MAFQQNAVFVGKSAIKVWPFQFFHPFAFTIAYVCPNQCATETLFSWAVIRFKVLLKDSTFAAWCCCYSTSRFFFFLAVPPKALLTMPPLFIQVSKCSAVNLTYMRQFLLCNPETCTLHTVCMSCVLCINSVTDWCWLQRSLSSWRSSSSLSLSLS